jgi:hypothetical protein
VTDEFAGLVKRMLSKKPEDRPASMEDFLTEMRGLVIFRVPPASLKKTAHE